MKEKVIITRQIPDKHLQPLFEHFDVIQINDHENSKKLLEQHIADASAILCMLSDQIHSELITKSRKLKIIANYAVGYNNIDIIKSAEKNIIVTNTPDVLTDATADLAFNLILNCARNYSQARNYILEGKWKRWEAKELLGLELRGKTLGIYGLGRIGQAVATRAEAFGMNIIYHNRSQKNSPYPYVNFENLLKQSDFLSAHCPLNENSKMRFTINEFMKMKKQSVFINTARGEMHNEEDLFQALETKHLFAAGLDVTNPEPCSKDSSLLKLDNCYITPHIGSATVQARNLMAKICVENIVNVLQGRQACSQVN